MLLTCIPKDKACFLRAQPIPFSSSLPEYLQQHLEQVLYNYVLQQRLNPLPLQSEGKKAASLSPNLILLPEDVL